MGVSFDPDAFRDALFERLRPERLLADIDLSSLGPRIALLSLGKPAEAYARALRRLLGPRIIREIVVGPHAGHPVPNADSFAAGEALIRFAEEIASDADLVCFIGGGGSALAESPRPPCTAARIIARTRELIERGAPIAELNAERAGMSRIKNGGLLEGCRARRVVTLVLVDVPSDDPALVASGPTIDGKGEVIRIAGYPELARIAAELLPGARIHEPAFDEPLESGIERHLELLADTPLITGGELTTPVLGDGRGGRNTEFVIRLAHRLRNESWRVMSLATDGCDANSGSAGGWIDSEALRGVDIEPWLARSDTATLLAERGTLFPQAQTDTNLMDLHIVARSL